MDKYIRTFVSTNGDGGFTVFLFAFLSILSLIILITYFLKSELSFAKKLRSPFSLLLLGSVFATASIASYTWKNTSELDTVVITNDSVITPFGSCKFTNIKDANFINVLPYGKSDSTKFLLIEEYTGKAHPINGENYNITAILEELKKHISADKAH